MKALTQLVRKAVSPKNVGTAVRRIFRVGDEATHIRKLTPKRSWQAENVESIRNVEGRRSAKAQAREYSRQNVKDDRKSALRQLVRLKPESSTASRWDKIDSRNAFFKNLPKSVKIAGVGVPATYALASFAPVPQSLADYVADHTSEDDSDIFNVKDAVRESQNLWEMRKVIDLRDEMRERGITSDLLDGTKLNLDVRTLPTASGSSGEYTGGLNVSITPWLSVPQGLGDVLSRAGVDRGESLTPGGILAHEIGHTWHHQNQGGPVDTSLEYTQNYGDKTYDTAYAESIAENFSQLTRKYGKPPSNAEGLSDWGPLMRINYGVGFTDKPTIAEWNKGWNEAQRDLIAKMAAEGTLKSIQTARHNLPNRSIFNLND